MDAERDDEGYDDDGDASDDDAWDLSDHGAYWRRRFFILCAGVVAFGICAWLLPGARHAAVTSAAARESGVAAATRGSLPPAAYGPAWSSPVPSPSPTPSPGDSAKLAEKTKKLHKVGTSYHPRHSASPSASSTSPTGKVKAGAACTPADIVLSLFTSQASYGRNARPRFNVYAVSTAAADCKLSYGRGAVQVIVTNHGHVVWNSAACDPPPAKPVRFTLGVPQLLTLTWNRKAASPAGCAGSLPADFTGTLRAVAMSHGQSSPVRTFSIGKLSPAPRDDPCRAAIREMPPSAHRGRLPPR